MLGVVTLEEAIGEAWGWIGLVPVEVTAVNAFGNVIVLDQSGQYWRICPEDLYCKIVARTSEEYEALWVDSEFIEDWEMANLVAEARKRLGKLQDGYRYCLKIPGLLGGEYGGNNIASAPQIELIGFSGDIARQIRDLPDGAQVELQVVD